MIASNKQYKQDHGDGVYYASDIQMLDDLIHKEIVSPFSIELHTTINKKEYNVKVMDANTGLTAMVNQERLLLIVRGGVPPRPPEEEEIAVS